MHTPNGYTQHNTALNVNNGTVKKSIYKNVNKNNAKKEKVAIVVKHKNQSVDNYVDWHETFRANTKIITKWASTKLTIK